MKRKKILILLAISIILLLIGVCIYLIPYIHFIPEKYTYLEDGTKVTGDTNKIEILNYTVFTYNVTNPPQSEYIGEGFIHSENATEFEVMVYYKNIANETIENMEITIQYYDINNNLLKSPPEYYGKKEIFPLEKSKTTRCFFYLSNYFYDDFEKVDHISFQILPTKTIDTNTIAIILIIIGILFLLTTLYSYKNKKTN
ncbi:MAG: hypothetical protein ACQXXF_07740 [Thermoplasmatota archaeon]|jgi:hypothetical protein